ncbi:EexN family lipoprotein [Citrobacter sp. CtB7.12]|uniref:EexN family lipoprotein n=1 Tax=Citrobacter sp. CtB7.12 TaxID=1696093 RepID=UPI0006BA4C6C|nr:EexN family lipoprotein [Citrobacter sp. CtB7.12]
MLSSKIISFATVLLFFILTGCEDEAKTTKWYKDHPDELKTVYDKCQKTGTATENCKNASEANYQIKQLNAQTPDLNNLEE